MNEPTTSIYMFMLQQKRYMKTAIENCMNEYMDEIETYIEQWQDYTEELKEEIKRLTEITKEIEVGKLNLILEEK